MSNIIDETTACGKGSCAAMAGHEGSCLEASGHYGDVAESFAAIRSIAATYHEDMSATQVASCITSIRALLDDIAASTNHVARRDH